MKRRRFKRVRLSRRAVIGIVVLAVLFGVADVGIVWRFSRVVDRMVRDWAAKAIADQSGGVYVLDFSPARVNWLLRRVTVDSLSLTTRRALNASRPTPLPGLSIALTHCAISGVHLFTLIRKGGLVAGSLGCRGGGVMVEIPGRKRVSGPGAGDSASASGTNAQPASLLASQRGLRLPSLVPRVRLGRVLFPHLAAHLRLSRESGRPTPLEVEQLQLTLSNLVIDQADTAAASNLLFSRAIELTAINFAAYQHEGTAVRVPRIRASLTDSTLEARGIGYGPTGSGAAFVHSKGYGRDLVRLDAARFSAEGVDYGAFLVGRGVRARRIVVDSVRVDVTSDKALLKNPRNSYGTPQQFIAAIDQSVSVDSLHVRDGAVVYREHSAGRANVGVLRFTRLEAVATSLSHRAGQRSSDAPMTLTARAYLQDAGRFDVQMVVPLDAPRFDLAARGTLGAMPTNVINPFFMETHALKIGDGQVQGIAFNLRITNGVATGTITPRWTDLSVTVTRAGSAGILGGRGFFGGAARDVANIAAGMQVRADNPERGKAPRSGAIHQVWAPTETLIAFLWTSVRDALLLVARK